MLNLNIPPQKLVGWFRRPQLWAAADGQLHHDNEPTLVSYRVFLQNIKSPRWLSPPKAQIWCPVTSGFFPKLKSPSKGNRFETIYEIQKNMMGQLMVIERTVWGPRVPTLKGIEASLSHVQCFLYLVSSSRNVSIFHITWPDTFWTGLVYLCIYYLLLNSRPCILIYVCVSRYFTTTQISLLIFYSCINIFPQRFAWPEIALVYLLFFGVFNNQYHFFVVFKSMLFWSLNSMITLLKFSSHILYPLSVSESYIGNKDKNNICAPWPFNFLNSTSKF